MKSNKCVVLLCLLVVWLSTTASIFAANNVSSVTPPTNNTYIAGWDLVFKLNYQSAVTVTTSGNNPSFQISIGGSSKTVKYTSGSGTSSLTFKYTVQSGDNDSNGISFVSSGGNVTISTSGGASLGGASTSFSASLANLSNIFVDTTAPTIQSVTKPSSGSYGLGANLDFTVNTSENVNVDTSGGTPYISINVGGSTKHATYTSGSGSSALLFRYTIQSGDSDSNGISVSSPLQLNGGTIKDTAGNAMTSFTFSTFIGTVTVDTTAPTISSVSGPNNGSYGTGANLDFTINTSESVTVSGSPRITVTVGSNARNATYNSGASSSTHIVFRYTVVNGDTDTDGVVYSSPINLNGGSIKDAAGNDLASLTFTPPDTSSVLVDTTAPTITSVDQPANGTYIIGQNLDFTVHFSENVTLSNGFGNSPPRIVLRIGNTSQNATLTSGNNSSALTFRYTVQSGDSDSNGISGNSTSSPINSITMGNGSIRDAAGNDLSPTTFTALNTTGVLVDGIAPTLNSVSPPSNGSYKAGAVLSFTANYSENVTVSGTPSIPLSIGGNNRSATYTSGSGSSAIVFQYTVQAGENDSSGISFVSAGGTVTIALNGGTMTDSAGNNADRTFSSFSMSNVKVDTTAPTISSVSGPSSGSYRAGQNLNFTVNMSETVTVSGGTPSFSVNLDTGTVTASYVSGSGSSQLTFRYTIQSTDSDPTGISISSPISLNGATIADAAANPLSTLTFTPPNLSNVKVDTTAPTISTVSGPSSGSYRQGDNLDFKVTFSETVNVSGFPAATISLNVGGTTKTATYQSGSGSSTLTFRYTVGSSENDSDGLAMISPINPHGATIADAAGNALTDFTFTPPDTSGVIIDNTAPTIQSITPPANGSYKAGAHLDYTVSWSEPVYASGNPRIQITVGSTSRDATLLSGSGTTTHVYRYTVQAGETDSNGITTPTSIHTSSFSTLKDLAGNSANTSFGTVNTSQVLVDTTAPTITSVTGPSDGYYIAGQTLSFTVTYSEAVNVTGTPFIGLNIGGSTTPHATYQSGSGSTSLTFSYTVQWGDNDSDGIASISPIDVTGGTIQDAATNDAVETFTPPTTTGVLVDTTIPTITSVSGPADGAYNAGKNLDFTVNFSEIVNVNTNSGVPYISLTVGSLVVQAGYLSGSNSTALVFCYTVQPGDTDTDGVLLASTINVNSGTIQDVAGNNAYIGFTSPTTTGVIVDTTAPNPPVVVGISPDTGSSSSDGNTTNQNLTIFGTAEAYSKVTLTITPNIVPGIVITPAQSLPLTVWADANGNWTNDYSSVTLDEGGYTITATATDAAGNVSVDSDPFSLVIDLTPPAAPVITGISPDTGHSSTDANTTNQTFTISGTAETNSTVKVTLVGTGVIGTVTADSSGNWSFYTESSLDEGSYSFTAAATDVAGNPGPDSDAYNVVVDLTPPAINISAPTTPITQDSPFSYTVTYSDDYFYTSTLSTSDITLHTTGTAHGTVDVSGSGTSYTVTISNVGGVGSLWISIGAGTAVDDAGNLASGADAQATGVVAVTRTAKILNVSADAGGKFKAGATITLTVQFNTQVTVDAQGGTPSICLNSGGTAYYSGAPVPAVQIQQGGSGSKVLKFTYTVQQGENSLDLDYTSMTALHLNGGHIYYAAAGTESANVQLPAPGTVGSLGVNEHIEIDTAGPAISFSDPSVTGTRQGPVTYTVTYTDHNFQSSSLSASDVSLVTFGTATGTVSVDSGTSSNRVVTISNISGDGTIAIKIGPNTAVDILGNQSGCSGTSTSFTVGPVLNITPVPNLGASAAIRPFDVIGIDGSNIITVTGSPNTTYKIVYSTSLTNPSWQFLTCITTDENGNATFTDDNLGANENRFYRSALTFVAP